MAVNPVALFTPSGGAQADLPEDADDFERRRREARAAMAKALQQRQIQHPTQGIAQMMEAALAGYDDYKLRKDREAMQKEAADLAAKLYGGGTPPAPSAPPGITPKPAPVATPPSPPPPDLSNFQDAASPPPAAPEMPPMAPNLAGVDGGDPVPEMAGMIPQPAGDMGGYTPQQVPPTPGTAGGVANRQAIAQAMMGGTQAPSAPVPPVAPPRGLNPLAQHRGGAPVDPSGFVPPMPQEVARGTLAPPLAGPNMAVLEGMDAPNVPRATPPVDPMGYAAGQPLMPQQAAVMPPMPSPLAGRGMTAGIPKPSDGTAYTIPTMPTAAPDIPQAPAPRPQGMMGLGAPDGPLQFAGDFSAKNGMWRPLPKEAVKYAIAHDTSGVNGRLSDPQNLNQYNYLFDDKGIYKLRPDGSQAPHAKNYNANSIGFAYRGMEGQELPPAAIENGRKLAAYIQKEYGLTPEQFKTHPSLGPAGTASSGKNPKEAAWLAQVLGGQSQPPAQQTAAAPPAAEPRTPIASNPQATGLVQLAQNGPIDAETFKRMMLNPNTRPLAQQMLQRELERRQPPTEDKILDRDYKRAQIEALKRKDGTPTAEVQGRYAVGQSMGLKGEDLTRYSLTGKLPDKLDDPANDPNRVGQNIIGGLNSMARIPKEFGPTLDRAIGPVRGQESGILPAIGKIIGSIHNMAGDRNTSEVRARIAGDTEALAAQIKPLIRKPGEGTWSDSDQARLNALVGNLNTSRDVTEYKRNLEAVRQRLIDNFGVKLPPITWDDAPAKSSPQGTPGGLPPGWSARRIN